MMRWTILALLVPLAACGDKAATSNQQANASANASEDVAVAATPLPTASAGPRFVGIWAPTKAECTTEPWRFTAQALTGPGDHKCSFYKVSKAPLGYDIAATCPAKKPVPTDLFKLRFAESTQTMLVESNAIPPTGLVYCGK
jgi:hypothetical protein